MATKHKLFPARNGKIRTIEVAPGKTVVDLPIEEVPKICLSDLQPAGDGTYRAVAKVHQAEVPLSAPILQALGIRPDTMKRLIKAGFVDGVRVTPQLYTFRLESYFEHRARVKKAADEGLDFWTEDNLQRYRAAI